MIAITLALGIIVVFTIAVFGIAIALWKHPIISGCLICVLAIATILGSRQLATDEAEPLCFGEVGVWDLKSYGILRMTPEEYGQHCKEDISHDE